MYREKAQHFFNSLVANQSDQELFWVVCTAVCVKSVKDRCCRKGEVSFWNPTFCWRPGKRLCIRSSMTHTCPRLVDRYIHSGQINQPNCVCWCYVDTGFELIFYERASPLLFVKCCGSRLLTCIIVYLGQTECSRPTITWMYFWKWAVYLKCQ